MTTKFLQLETEKWGSIITCKTKGISGVLGQVSEKALWLFM